MLVPLLMALLVWTFYYLRVVERIEETTNHIYKGAAGKSFKDIHAIFQVTLNHLQPQLYAVKVTFDKVFSSRDDDDRKLVEVAGSIGRAVEDECQMQYYEQVAPGLLKVIKDNYWHRACGTQQKLVVVRTLINRSDVTPWKAWKQTVRVKLGNWLLNCIIEASGWFSLDTKRKGKKT